MAFATSMWMETTSAPDAYEEFIQGFNSTLGLHDNTTTDPGVWKKSLPVQLSLGVLGILGNLLSLLVFSRPGFSKLSTSVFLRTLSAVDISLIIVFNTCTVHAYVLNPNPSSLAEVRFHPVGQWFLISLATSSAWTIVSVSIERAIAVCLPLKVRALCTKKNAFITCCCMIPTLFIMNTPTLVVKPGPHDVLPLPSYFTILYSVLPSAIIMTCNVILVYKIRQRHGSSKKDMENRGLTIMLIVNSVGFVGLTLPYSIFHLMGNRITDEIHIVRLLKILESLSAINHSMNFIFYGLSGSLFRRELRKMLCGRCWKDEKSQQIAAVTPQNRGTDDTRETRERSGQNNRHEHFTPKLKNDMVGTDSGFGSELEGESSSQIGAGKVDEVKVESVNVALEMDDGMVSIPLSDTDNES